MIVVYIEDERKGVEFGKLFVEKGFDNIYLLSGGFENFAEHFPDLLEGKKAAVYQAKNPTKKVIKPVIAVAAPVVPSAAASAMKPADKMMVTGKITGTGIKKQAVEKKEVTGKITTAQAQPATTSINI